MAIRSISRISVVVPVYNVIDTLDRCIQSLITQDYPAVEIILVDDGSTDGSEVRCDEYAATEPNITVIHKTNGGLSSARNAGLRRCSGDYVLYVDSDDYIKSDACSRFAACLAGSPDIVVGDAIELNGSHVAMMSHDSIDDVVHSGTEFIKRSIESLQWYAPAWLNLYRRQFLIENNLFYVEGILHEDMEMLPRVFLAAKSVRCLHYDFYQYVVRAGSIMTNKVTDKQIENMREIYSAWYKRFSKIKDDELRSKLNGFLVKCYLYSCGKFELSPLIKISEIDFHFILKYSLSNRERIKGLVYCLLPKLFYRLYVQSHTEAKM